MSAISLRDYQRRAIDSLYQYFDVKSGNPLVVAPTGSGKSVILGALCREIIESWPNQRLMILSHVKELLEQNFSKILAFWPEAPAGLYCAGLGKQQARDPITVASIQSIYRKPHLFGWRDLILVDEAHLLAPDSDTMYQRFLDGLRQTNRHVKVVGLTATAYRLKSGLLHEGKSPLFTDVACEITLQELLEAGHICPLVSKSSAVQADLSGVGLVGGEFNARDSELAMDKAALTAAALDEVLALAADRRSWLFFCSGVKHAEHVGEALRVRGIDAAVVTGETPAAERAEILRAFKAGEVRAVTNANVLTTGFDAPNIDLIVLLRPTTSPGLYTQILGRGMRMAPGKANCLVLDYAGNIERHGPITHVKPPKAAARREKQERHERTCLICPVCRMASPLGVMECAECGHTFARPERIKHDTTASTAQVMQLGSSPEDDAGEWLDVEGVEYYEHQKPDKTPTLRVEYVTKLQRYKEWVCLEHPPGFARAKALAWWRKRTTTEPPDNIKLALHWSDVLRKPLRIRVVKEDKYWRVNGYDLTGWTFQDRPAQEAGVDQQLAEPIDFG
jgi:DNA repair protein RadD